MRLKTKLADRDGFEPPQCLSQSQVPYRLANGLQKQNGGRYRDRTCGPTEQPRFSKPLHYRSGNLPKGPGYEFRGRSNFAVGLRALPLLAKRLILEAEDGFEPSVSGL
jgi:hypothetical protein